MNSMADIPPIIKNGVLLLISLNFPPETNGGATGAWNRAKVLHNLGFQIFVLAGFSRSHGREGKFIDFGKRIMFVERLDNITVIRVWSPNLDNEGFFRPFVVYISFVIICLLVIPKVFKMLPKVDVIYARSPIVFSSIVGFIYSRLLHSFYIYEAPDVWPDELIVIKSPLLPFIMSFGKIISKMSYCKADIIITVSESAAEYIKSHYKPNAKVFGIPSGVDPEKFAPTLKSIARNKLIEDKLLPSILYDKFVVLYSGRISPAQKIDDLISAAKKLIEFKNIYIIIIGGGATYDRLHKLKVQNNLNNIIFLPFQKRELMPLIISSVDVCTLFLAPEPVYGIAIPTKFYEYLSCLKPVIGVCHGEVEKIIKKYNIGLTCQNGDVDELADSILKMRKIIDSTDLLPYCTDALKNFSLQSISLVFAKVLGNNYPNKRSKNNLNL